MLIASTRKILTTCRTKCISNQASRSTNLYQTPRLGTTCPISTFIGVRRVIIAKKDKKLDQGTAGIPPATNTIGTVVTRPEVLDQSPTGINDLVQTSNPLIRKVPNLTKFDDLDVQHWLKCISMPPASYWDAWREALEVVDKGGLATAKKFLYRWADSIKMSFHRQQREISDGECEVFACTAHFEMPLLGIRKVVSYGYTAREARKNVYHVLISKMYKSGELDMIYQGTLASRRQLQCYVQAAQYGLFPRFKVSTVEAYPAPKFQITMAVPEWNIRVLSMGRSYVDALTAALDDYQTQVAKRDVKKKLTPEATKARLGKIKTKTVYQIFTHFLKQQNTTNSWRRQERLDTPGPQNLGRVLIAGVDYAAHVPMLRKLDAQIMANITAVVRYLQKHGFDKIDSFKDFSDAKAGQNMSKRIEGQDDVSTKDHVSSAEESMADMFDQFNELPDDDKPPEEEAEPVKQ